MACLAGCTAVAEALLADKDDPPGQGTGGAGTGAATGTGAAGGAAATTSVGGGDASTCVPDPGTAPVARVAAGLGMSCPSGWGLEFTWVAAPVQTGCEPCPDCTTSAGTCTIDYTVYDNSGCSSSTNLITPLTEGACVDVITSSSDNIVTGASSYVANAKGTPGACVPGSSSPMPLEQALTFCRLPGPVGEECETTGVLVPAGDGQAVCAVVDSPASCPEDYQFVYTLTEVVTDDRDCACQCESTSCDEASIALFSDGVCTMPTAGGLSADGMCVSSVSGASSAAALGLEPPTCNAQSVDNGTGVAFGTSVTLCCYTEPT